MLSSKKRVLPNHNRLKGQNKRLKRTPDGPGKIVKLDDLAWKSVAMPDRLDDVEGFFGLEEVEGVDVVVGESGAKTFRVLDEAVSEKSRKAGKSHKSKETGVNEEDEEGEWGGIQSSDVEDAPTSSSRPLRSALKKNRKTQDSTLDSSLANINFSVLAEAQEEDTPLPAWDHLELSQPTLRALSKLAFTTPTPIQAAAIPHIITGHDLIGKAATGSGKTLAFGIPILENFLLSISSYAGEEQDSGRLEAKNRQLTALIISPTRELAHQITKHLTDIAQFTDLKIVPLTGGLSVQKQIRLLGSGADVIVATPGRLWEVISDGQGWLEKIRKVKMLVIDEADRVLEAGHFKEVEQILTIIDAQEGESSDEEEDEGDAKARLFGEDNVIEKAKRKAGRNKKGSKKSDRISERQTLVFSATFHKGLQKKLAGRCSKRDLAEAGELLGDKESITYLLKKLKFREKPKWVDVDPIKVVSEKVKEGIVECGALEKDLYLYYLLLRYPYRTLVFTNSISSVRRLVPFLNQLLQPVHNGKSTTNDTRAYPLHSQMAQKARLRSLERFADPKLQFVVLVATDVAARGLDIRNVELVLHYHLPRSADMYVHRSGRSARGDEEAGVSMILCAPGEALVMNRLVAKVHAEVAGPNGRGSAIKRLDMDMKVIGQLKRRVELAKLISDAEQENQKQAKEEDWLRVAAGELGVDVSDSEIAVIAGKGKNRNKGKGKDGQGGGWDDDIEGLGQGDERKKALKTRSKQGIAKLKHELRLELGKQINKGFSTKYLTGGIVNMAEHLLSRKSHKGILGEQNTRLIEDMR